MADSTKPPTGPTGPKPRESETVKEIKRLSVDALAKMDEAINQVQTITRDPTPIVTKLENVILELTEIKERVRLEHALELPKELSESPPPG